MDYSEQIRELFEMARKDAEFAAITKEYLLLEYFMFSAMREKM